MSDFWVREKRASILVKKYGRGGKKKCDKKCAAKLWASKQHLQKLAPLFSMLIKLQTPNTKYIN